MHFDIHEAFPEGLAFSFVFLKSYMELLCCKVSEILIFELQQLVLENLDIPH